MTGTDTLKPIETTWRGYAFRSRLEARWAVFFERLGVRWEYEPEGFQLEDGTRYLPDFRVWSPQGEPIWYEVKPAHVVTDAKFEMFREALERNCDFGNPVRAAMLRGDPVDWIGRTRTAVNGSEMVVGVCPRCGFIDEPGSGEVVTRHHCSFGCHPCDFQTPSGGDNEWERGLHPEMPVRPHKGWVTADPEAYVTLHLDRVDWAAKCARSARFEHGASPK